MKKQYIHCSKTNHVATVTIDKESSLNALNKEVLTELDQTITELENDMNCRVLILTGKGKAFVAGADIAQMKTFPKLDAKKFSKLGQDVFNHIENSHIVSIGAINGFALGGGLELALSCDIRISNLTAKFGLPEVTLGLIPGFGGTQRLPRLVGLNLAKEMIFSGEFIDSERAEKIGLINLRVDNDLLMNTCLDLATKICQRGPQAIKMAKKCIQTGFHSSFDTGLKIEADEFSNRFQESEFIEGTSAFLEKRKPNFP